MKKSYLLVSLLLVAVCLSAQPNLMNYQGVARDRSGRVVDNKNISLQIHIIAGEVNESPVYTEIHKITTSQFGVFTIHIGAGIPLFGEFDAIAWGLENHYVKVEMDIKGGTNFKDMGTTQLLSVPYAFHAQTAGSLLEAENFRLKKAKPGVKSQTWSMFGNRETNPEKDRLGTTDSTDLVIVSNNKEAMRIRSNGNVWIANKLDIGGNLRVRGDSVIIDHNLYVGDTTNTRSLYVKDDVADEGDGGFVATFENENDGKGDGIAIKLGREETTHENNFITFYRKDKVAGRIEGYYHKLGDKPVIVEKVEGMLGASKDFYEDVIGFTAPFEINFGSLPSVSGQKWPKFDPGSLPSTSSWGSLPSLDFSNASFPILNPGELPSVKFSSNVDDYIQPWGWFSPDFSSVTDTEDPEESNNPVFNFIMEAQENDWKTLVGLGLPELAAKIALMEMEAIAKSGGITYGSKGADYAEWLPRVTEEENLAIGQVVGVHGGKISLKTEDADQILVISSKPIVLGNMPDEENADKYEKVAFLGQVPTWVRGHVNIGDYILSSGQNDGAAIAVPPEKLRLEDMDRIIGKAWSESNNLLLNLINVAIGLNRNDLAKIALSQQQKINDLETRVGKMEEVINQINGGMLTEK